MKTEMKTRRPNALFFGPYPTEATSKDGMAQRVASMDGAFSSHARLYITSSTRRWFLPRVRRVSPNCSVVYAAWPFSSLLGIAALLLLRPNLIYLHSVYELFKNPFTLIPRRRVVLDAHGLVPEELKLSNNNVLSFLCGWLERAAFRRFSRFIAVTGRMVEHFDRKYPEQRKREWYVIPVIGARHAGASVQTPRDVDVIYVGGLHAWQNIPAMLDTALRCPEKTFKFVVSDPLQFHRSYGGTCAALPNVTVTTCAPRDAAAELQAAKYGLVLREDIPINRVACPTKVLEYVDNGVVPVFGRCDIGDFVGQGLQVARADDPGRFSYTDEELDRIRTHNRDIIEQLRSHQQREMARLQSECHLGRGNDVLTHELT